MHLSAIKGVGEAAVESIVEERKLNGPYQSHFRFCETCKPPNSK
jgi:DNA polymerase III alpha subunit